MNVSGAEGPFQREFINRKLIHNKEYAAGEILACRACFTNIGIRKMSDKILAMYCKVTNTTRQKDENPCFPVCICSTCLTLLRKLHKFQLQCQHSYIHLQKLALWGNLDSNSLIKFSATNSFLRSLKRSRTQVIDSLESQLETTTQPKIYLPITTQTKYSFQVNNPTSQPYHVENPNTNAPFHKHYNATQTINVIKNGRNEILNIEKTNNVDIQISSRLENSDKPKVFIASCVKGKRSVTLENGRDGSNIPTVYNNIIPTSTLTNRYKNQPGTIVVNNGVIENLPVGLNKNSDIYFLMPPPTLTAADSEVVTRIEKSSLDRKEVFRDGNLQFTYFDSAKTILEVSDTAPQTIDYLKGKSAPPSKNLATVAKHNKNMLAENTNRNSDSRSPLLYALLNDNAKNPNIPKTTNDENATINMVTNIKTETEIDEEQTCDNDEPNDNIGEVTNIKSELDDIVKVEHLIHPVEDYEKNIDEENTSQQDQNQTQQQPSKVDDKVVEIDDSSSSSNDSSSTSSSSSSSSSDSDSDVEAVDLTLEDDETVVVNAKETETLTNSVYQTDSLNKNVDTEQDANFDDTNE